MDRVIAKLPSVRLKLDLLQGGLFSSASPRHAKASYTQPDTVTLDVNDEERKRLENQGAIIFEDVQFEVFPDQEDEILDDDYSWTAPPSDDSAIRSSLADVMTAINAPSAWRLNRGRGVTVAIVDTGIAAGLREVEKSRRSQVDLRTHYLGNHWDDPKGHGSMCAAIAAGAKGSAGRYDGVAPEATVLAARSTLRAGDLLDIFDELLRARDQGEITGPLVISNSYGLRTCSSPNVLPEAHPFFGSILTAIDRGVFVCFAAGNSHHSTCRFDPSACGPNSIWGPNSHDRIISVGTVNRDLTNCDPLTPHVDSSRGPGEWAQLLPKPDCVAPTYGEVPWGTVYRTMKWWGTSGACPQVAGLAALILAAAPKLKPEEVGEIIRKTCMRLPLAHNCVGKGVIDCDAAVSAALAAASA